MVLFPWWRSRYGVTVCVMTKQASDVFHFDLNPRPGWRSKWKKTVDLRGERTVHRLSVAKSCSHMTTKDSKMPLRKTFCLYSPTVAVRNSCHVNRWPRKNVPRSIKLVKRFGGSVKTGRNIFCHLPSPFLLFCSCPSVSCLPSPCSGFQECTECPYLCPCKHEGEPAAEAKFFCRSQAGGSRSCTVNLTVGAHMRRMLQNELCDRL